MQLKRVLLNGMKVVAIAFCSAAIAKPVLADTITGNITFLKKASYAGVVYMLPAAPVESLGITGNIDQKDKAFTKKIVVTAADGALQFNNSDVIDHNIFANDLDTNVKFDVGLMTPNSERKIDTTWESDSLVRIGCKIHPKMKAYVFNSPSPYYQVLEFKKGVNSYDFTINDVPKDVTKLALKIPKYQELIIDIAEGSQTVDVLRKGKKKADMTVTRTP